MKIFICGASGLLGRELYKKLKNCDIEVKGTYYTNKIDDEMIIFDANTIKDVILEFNPDIIINCIVNRFVDICETNFEKIKYSNIIFVEELLKLNIKIIHISTDYVFDGSKSPYYTSDTTFNPLNNYGISKLIAELRIKSNENNHLIIRVPVLFTDSYLYLNESSVTMIGKKLFDKTKNFYQEDAISIRRPVYIPILCNFIYDCIIGNYKGIYHFYNPIDKITKMEILNYVSMFLNVNKKIRPLQLTNSANRPLDTEMKDDKYDIYKYYKDYDFYEIIDKCFGKFKHNFKDAFLLLDLDGTIIDSEKYHYQAYNRIFNMTEEEFYKRNENNDFDDLSAELKNRKNEELRKILMDNDLYLMPGAESFINYICDNRINTVVVTNTSFENVNMYKQKLPILDKLKKWISKEDYNQRKPNPECYEKAKELFYNNESYIIGIENTLAGYKALKEITDIIYMNRNNTNHTNDLDVFIFNDYKQIINNC